MNNQTVSDGKIAAIIAYITIVGTLVAYIMNVNKKNSFTSFHIRQMIGLFLMFMINRYIVYDLLGSTAGWLLGIVLFAFWLIGILGAIQGEEKEIPVVGEHFQNWFQAI